jgi:hypothetical protein
VKNALKDFIDRRINSNYYKLRNDEDWRETNAEYNFSYEKLHEKLPKEHQEELDNIIDLKNILMGYETNFGYKVGANDAIKLFKL